MRLLATTAALLVALVLAGALYQSHRSAADREAYPPPGRLVDVDGIEMHIDCRGTGTPQVVLEAGLTSGSASWMLVHDALAEVTRVCAYDRPGIDWSEPIGRSADAAEIAARLKRLLEVAGTEGPTILLGMSAGGVYVREYQRTWPGGIVGMVLVDSSHEQQGRRLPEIEAAGAMEKRVALCAWLQPIGVIRAFSLLDGLLDQFELPPGPREVIRANLYQSHSCASIRAEMQSFAGEVLDAEPPTSLGGLPLVVLSQGKEPEGVEAIGLTVEAAREQRKVWNVLQDELTALSTRGRRIVATRSGHVIQFDQPQLLIDAVADLVLELRESSEAPGQARPRARIVGRRPDSRG